MRPPTRSAIRRYSGSTTSATHPRTTPTVWPGKSQNPAVRKILQPIQREVIRKFAGNNESEQSRTGKAPPSIAVSAFTAASIWGFSPACSQRGAGILLAHMPQAFEVPGEVFDLPALLAADLSALLAAARTEALFCSQLIDVRARPCKMFENPAKARRPLRRCTRRTSGLASPCGTLSAGNGFFSSSSANSSSACASSFSLKRSARGQHVALS